MPKHHDGIRLKPMNVLKLSSITLSCSFVLLSWLQNIAFYLGVCRPRGEPVNLESRFWTEFGLKVGPTTHYLVKMGETLSNPTMARMAIATI